MNKNDMVVYVLEGGDVCYSAHDGAEDINEMIRYLEKLRGEEGVTQVVLSSGNYRGAQYQAVILEGDLL